MEDNTTLFKIDWSSKSKLRGPGEQSLGELVRQLRDRLAPKAQGISISYVDDRHMRRLNREHRGINLTTDILSFPAEPEAGAYPHLGDLVICLPVAEKMAQKLSVSRRREVETLLIHGFLHLCGYDHEIDQGEMLTLQGQLEREFLEVEPLPMSLKRGRKPGSKIKVMKDGTRVVVTGRAAGALKRLVKPKKVKAQKLKASRTDPSIPKRGPGRPRKDPSAKAAPVSVRRTVRRKRLPKPRSGVIS
jgi:probable rRNA maturation factor